MSDKVFVKNFSLMIGALAALTVIIFIMAQIIGSQSASVGADDKAVAERIQSAGALTVVGAVMESVIPSAHAAANGKKTYDTACVACHGTGIAGAPKTGDKAAWKARIAKGNAKLYEHAIKGVSSKPGVMMPAKGGRADISDADVKAAVDFMVNASK